MILHSRFAIMKFDKYHNVDNPILSCVVDFYNVQLLKVPSNEAL